MKYLLTILQTIALSNAAAIERETALSPSDNRIVGGKDTNIFNHPHQISLRYKSLFEPQNAFRHRCGGSIMDELTIVTAAHCIIATVPSQYQIVAGSNYRTGSDGVILPIKEIVMHEQYDPNTFDNDVALLFLGAPLPLNNFTIKAIELTRKEVGAGAPAIVTGWGTTASGGTPSATLQEVTMPVVANDVCNKDYDGVITDSMLCAGLRGVGGKDACQGDSGGPLVVNGKLAGIVSWGYSCALPEYPGVYAKVSYLLPWIEQQVQKHHQNLIKSFL